MSPAYNARAAKALEMLKIFGYNNLSSKETTEVYGLFHDLLIQNHNSLEKAIEAYRAIKEKQNHLPTEML